MSLTIYSQWSPMASIGLEWPWHLFSMVSKAPKTLKKSNVRKEKLIVALSLRVLSIMVGRVTAAGMWGSWSNRIWCQETKSRNCSLFFIQSRTWSCGTVPTDINDYRCTSCREGQVFLGVLYCIARKATAAGRWTSLASALNFYKQTSHCIISYYE